MRSDLVDVEVEIKHETDSAVLVNDGDIEVWLPLSQIEVAPKPGHPTLATITMPQWLAEEKELV